MGLRGGCDVEFNNCELIGKKVYGGLFFHDAINPTYKGEQNIKVKNCIISAQDGGFLMRIQSQNVDGFDNDAIYKAYEGKVKHF